MAYPVQSKSTTGTINTTVSSANNAVYVTGNSSAANGIYTLNPGNIWSGTTTMPATLTLMGDRPVIKIKEGEIDLLLLLRMMERMQDLLCVIKEDAVMQERYPALQSLYEQYQIINAMAKAEDDES